MVPSCLGGATYGKTKAIKTRLYCIYPNWYFSTEEILLCPINFRSTINFKYTDLPSNAFDIMCKLHKRCDLLTSLVPNSGLNMEVLVIEVLVNNTWSLVDLLIFYPALIGNNNGNTRFCSYLLM